MDKIKIVRKQSVELENKKLLKVSEFLRKSLLRKINFIYSKHLTAYEKVASYSI